VWEIALATGLSPAEFESAEDILTVIEILERRANGD
jgi:hypothetical protein